MQQVIHTRTSSSNFDRASSRLRQINQSWIYLQPYHQGLSISQLQVQEFLMLEVLTLWGILYSSPAIWHFISDQWIQLDLKCCQRQTDLSFLSHLRFLSCCPQSSISRGQPCPKSFQGIWTGVHHGRYLAVSFLCIFHIIEWFNLCMKVSFISQQPRLN